VSEYLVWNLKLGTGETLWATLLSSIYSPETSGGFAGESLWLWAWERPHDLVQTNSSSSRD